MPKEEKHEVSALVDHLINRALAAGATDLHFEPVDEGLLVRIRVDGLLTDFDFVPADLAQNVIARLKILASLLTYRIDIPQEGSFLWSGAGGEEGVQQSELRVATFPTIRGERAVLRVFRASPELHRLDSLGLSPRQVARLREAIAQPAGLVVVSGPAGSGKTTTLYAMIRELRDHFPGRSLITLEDPVEQRLDRVAQVQANPYGELGYERCLRSLLRQDPQVILLGEVRDRQTAAIAIEAALTGHLILTTVHSGDPAETIVRFIEMGIPAYQLCSALTLVCSQRLMRKRCQRCQGSIKLGCETCLETGYSGRTAIAQFAELDERLRALVLDDVPSSGLRVELIRQGPSLVEQARSLAAVGVTDDDEIARVLGSSILAYHAEVPRVA